MNDIAQAFGLARLGAHNTDGRIVQHAVEPAPDPARRAGERGWQRLNTCAMEAHARMDAALRALGAAAREAVLGS